MSSETLWGESQTRNSLHGRQTADQYLQNPSNTREAGRSGKGERPTTLQFSVFGAHGLETYDAKRSLSCLFACKLLKGRQSCPSVIPLYLQHG